MAIRNLDDRFQQIPGRYKEHDHVAFIGGARVRITECTDPSRGVPRWMVYRNGIWMNSYNTLDAAKAAARGRIR